MSQTQIATCPDLCGATFRKAYQAGLASELLYEAVSPIADSPAPFADVQPALADLSKRIAWRLAGVAREGRGGAAGLTDDPDPNLLEWTEALALVFPDPPLAVYGADMPGAHFWNWWEWVTGAQNAPADPSENMLTDLSLAERLAAGAAAIAVLNAQPQGAAHG